MTDIKVKQFAETLKIEAEKLIENLNEAGIDLKSPEDLISDEAKLKLLQFLRSKKADSAKPSSGSKITLKRKSMSQVKLTNTNTGKDRTVSIEVRKKKTYVKRAPVPVDVSDEKEMEIQNEEKTELKEAIPKVTEEPKKSIEKSDSKKPDNNEDLTKDDLKKRKNVEDWRAAQKQKDENKALQKLESDRNRKETKKTRDNTLHIAEGASARKKQKAQKSRSSLNIESQHVFEKPVAPVIKEVKIPDTINVSELSQKLSIKSSELLKVLMGMGVMATINQHLDQDTAILLVEELGHKAEPEDLIPREEAIIDAASSDSLETAETRHPVVTIMGHVDHGKTSLLDLIRKTKVTEGEAGGITQHIGAYHVDSGKSGITFIDTPGHAAFTSMRARGANITDIVILVVAADDGVMPQTIEAIQHAKAASVPIIVAVNKIDRPTADPDKIKNELSAHEIIPEEWGGEHIFVNVSALTGEGIESLLESILLQAEILDLKAPFDSPGKGVIIESRIEKGRGAVATVLITSGTLNVGDTVLAGNESGKVRGIFSDTGESIKRIAPSMPGEVIGLSGAPLAGDELLVLNDDKAVKEVAKIRQERERDLRLSKKSVKLEDAFTNIGENQKAILNLLIKADVQGSAEALRDSLTNLSNDDVTVNIISHNVGGINASDAQLANASKAIMIGFNVRADSAAKNVIKEHDLDIRYYSIIYEVIDDVKLALSGLLEDEVREEIIGIAEVRDIFKSPNFGKIAGCLVTEGNVKKTNPIRVLRDNVVIYEGTLESLRRFKDDVNEVQSGVECGIGVKNYDDVKVGDQIECYERTTIERKIV